MDDINYDSDDIFMDCYSEDEGGHENVVHREGILKTSSRHSETRSVNESYVRYDDPTQMRNVIERAANNAKTLLRGLGGQSNRFDDEDKNKDEARKLNKTECCTRFYPATLEISARLHTDSVCDCIPHNHCILRGSPVTLKLPMELNPHNGQVNVNIIRSKPTPKPKMIIIDEDSRRGAGDRRCPIAVPGSYPIQRSEANHKRHSPRRVLWADV